MDVPNDDPIRSGADRMLDRGEIVVKHRTRTYLLAHLKAKMHCARVARPNEPCSAPIMSTLTSVRAMVSYAAGSVRPVKIPKRGAGPARRDLRPTMSGVDMDGPPCATS